MSDRSIEVSCSPDGDGWVCRVRVGDDAAATSHRVTVTPDDLARLAPAGIGADRLVEASFAFLLEREPRDSILREFALPVIGRYFPEYEAEIQGRLGAA